MTVAIATVGLLAACRDAATDTAPTSPATPASTDTAPAGTPISSSAPTEGGITFTVVLDGLDSPLDLAWRAGDPTLFVVQQGGLVVAVRDGTLGDPVLDLSPSVSNEGEQGLLGLAFHPTEPYAYVNYTDIHGDTVIAEYPVAQDGAFDTSGARTVITIEQPYGNHNGGNVAFGPDGYLYIGMGDGGAAFDPERRALDLGEPMGKILRIDPRPSGGRPYGVPADNPFVGVEGALPEIWSIGVRNPWRFAFDSDTGDLWIGDVGQDEWEEIDVAWAAEGGGRGVNFGWSALEGTHPANADQSPAGATPPVFEYSHGDGGCSVSGGTVYRGDAIASLTGWYLFGDYCSGKVWALRTSPGGATEVAVLGTTGGVSAIRPGPDGELYLLAINEGQLLRIDPT